MLKHIQKAENPLVFFSGDFLSPSLLSIVFKGEQMVPVFNSLPIVASCLGNHDFDHKNLPPEEKISEIDKSGMR